jgi:uncharacterized iron-regulated protein
VAARSVLICLLAAGCAAGAGGGRMPPITACGASGHWVDAAGHPIANPLPAASLGSVVLLGEQHDNEADHRWQLAALTYLTARRPGLVLGLEMFPRSKQAGLDAWSAGHLAEADFLARTDWKHVWGFDPKLYLPIFRFARDHGERLVALNVDGALVHRVARAGWAKVPASLREGVGDPAPPGAAYRARLLEEMSAHMGPDIKAERIAHFIDAQLLWDRAMAEAIARQHARAPGRLVVAMMGEGHLEYRDGVPAQLKALGLPDVAVFMPSSPSCGAPGA